MAERIHQSAETPSMLVANRAHLRCSGFDCRTHQRLRIVDDQKDPARRAADRGGLEPVQLIGRARNPESRAVHRQLGNDVVLCGPADAMFDLRAEGLLVERDGGRPVTNPELRLDIGPSFAHRQSIGADAGARQPGRIAQAAGRRSHQADADRLSQDLLAGAGERGPTRRRPESNRRTRLCRPLRSHSATSPARSSVSRRPPDRRVATRVPYARPWRAPGSIVTLNDPRAISSAGRAPPRQGGGHWFEPSITHGIRCARTCLPARWHRRKSL